MKAIIYILFFVSITSCNKQFANNSSKSETQKSGDSSNLMKDEKNLLKIHNTISEAFVNDRNNSSIALNSKKFTDSITYLIKNDTNTFHYPFELLLKENALNLVSSPDKKLRVYSWDNHLGGTIRFLIRFFNFNQTIKSQQKYIWQNKIHKRFFLKYMKSKTPEQRFIL